MRRTLVILFFLAMSVILNGCEQKPVCSDIQVPYQEAICTNNLEVRTLERNSVDSPAPSAMEEDCPEKGGLTHYGLTQVKWEFVNQNNVLLSTECKLLIRRNDFLSPRIMDEQQLEVFTVNIPAQDVTLLTRNVDLPKCYDFIGIDCEDIDELPECQPVTKYRTEKKCE